MVKKIVCVIVCMLLAGVAMAADRYVDYTKTAGNNDGTSWTDAYILMGSAMTDASATAIHVAAGKYRVTTTAGWAPTAASLTMDVKTGDTVILSGDINNNDTFADLTVDPCALQKAAVSGTHSENGRILDLTNKTMTITGFVFDGGTCATSGNGGSIQMSGTTTLTLNDCIIQQSYANGRGGAIYHNSTGTLTLNNCRTNHTSSDNRGSIATGGSSGSFVASNCYFQNAQTINYQAAIQPGATSTTNSITDCVFDRCRMCNNQGGSAGIQTFYDVNSTLTVTNCVFKECQSYHHGAAVYLGTDKAITNVDVTGNVTNCLVFGCTNWQSTGNDLAFHAEANVTGDNVTLNLTNCTVANNTANGQGHIGGWVYGNDATASATINLKNCIVWANTGDSDKSDKAQIFNDTAASGSSRVTITANYSCWDNSDPNDWGYAQDLGSNNLLTTSISGGTTGDPYLNPLLSGYMLDADSPCIDAGDPCSAYSAEPKCNGGRINMGWLGGTVLATPTTTTTKLADLDCDDDVDLADFSVMASQWLQ